MALATREATAIDLRSSLAASEPLRTRLPNRWGLLAALLAVAFVPRAFMAWRADVVCEDGPIYILAAQALEQGHYDLGFRVGNLGLNVYPVILMLLHKCGLEWLLAGRLWGLAMSTLVVLPLFGLLRRQMTDQVAAAACLLYAFHPTLIERSPEVLRCPTSWFLLLATMHLLWRAVLEVKLWLFLAAGACLALAVHTRVEAWFVLAPWTGWCAMRLRALRGLKPGTPTLSLTRRVTSVNSARWRLAAGCALGLAMIPLFIATVNLTWLRGMPEWQTCFSGRVVMLRELYRGPQSLDIDHSSGGPPARDAQPTDSESVRSAVQSSGSMASNEISAPANRAGEAVAIAAGSATPNDERRDDVSTGPTSTASAIASPASASPVAAAPRGMVWSYVQKLVDAFDPVFGLLSVVGMAVHWRLFVRLDQRPAFCMCLLHLLAIGLFLWKAHEVVGRYFFPVVLLSTPYAALGLFWLLNRMWAFAPRAGARLSDGAISAAPRWALAASFAAIAIAGWTDALTNDFSTRRQREELGGWIAQHVGRGQLMVGTEQRAMTLSYYAGGYYVGPMAHESYPAGFEQLCRRWSPGLIVLWNSSSERRRIPWLADYQPGAAVHYEYETIDATQLPANCRHVTLLVRRDLARLARAAQMLR